ncbi:carbohydrate kinase family protein [Saccharopolyspora sp. NPDC047091]|uniref:carbohydrate kinase family protein n=1 Tax=Saccharopolyspora sp. NPDC047091 TaxID=3155924 RepID=UPI0033C3A1DE
MGNRIVVAGVASWGVNVGVGEPAVDTAASGWRPRWLVSGLGGAAGHISTILRALGDEVELCTVAGRDAIGSLIRWRLREHGLDGRGVVDCGVSAEAAVLVGPDGRRAVLSHSTQIAAVQYPEEVFTEAVRGADLAVLTSTPFTRPLLAAAVLHGVPIAVDVNVIADVEDDYYGPWLEVADIVFCSHERLPCSAERWLARIFDRYPGCLVAAVGRGPLGCVLGLRDGRLVRAEAVAPLGVCNTSSAGDSLFAAFLHGWLSTGNAAEALPDAVLYAGWRIGHRFPSGVALTAAELARLRLRHPVRVRLDRWDR